MTFRWSGPLPLRSSPTCKSCICRRTSSSRYHRTCLLTFQHWPSSICTRTAWTTCILVSSLACPPSRTSTCRTTAFGILSPRCLKVLEKDFSQTDIVYLVWLIAASVVFSLESRTFCSDLNNQSEKTNNYQRPDCASSKLGNALRAPFVLSNKILKEIDKLSPLPWTLLFRSFVYFSG